MAVNLCVAKTLVYVPKILKSHPCVSALSPKCEKNLVFCKCWHNGKLPSQIVGIQSPLVDGAATKFWQELGKLRLCLNGLLV